MRTGPRVSRRSYGTAEAGEKILAAYTLAGPCQPMLLPRIGITEGNRQALTLGMTMPQLIDPERFNPAVPLWTGDAPDGERLDEYVAEEVKNEPHHGETPIGVSDETVEASRKALEAAQAAAPFVTKNKAEYERVVNDMHAIALLMQFYNAKTKAAEQVLLYGYDHDAAHLQQGRDTAGRKRRPVPRADRRSRARHTAPRPAWRRRSGRFLFAAA